MIKIFLARYFGLIILAASKDVSLPNRLHYFLEALGKTAVGVPTIGFGATHYGNGIKVRMSDKSITETQTTQAGYRQAL